MFVLEESVLSQNLWGYHGRWTLHASKQSVDGPWSSPRIKKFTRKSIKQLEAFRLDTDHCYCGVDGKIYSLMTDVDAHLILFSID